MKRRVFESGVSLLEFAVTLPIVLAFVLGTLDVARVLHAYNALQHGVTAGLRCAFPTDGECNSAIQTGSLRYDVSLLGTVPEYYVTEFKLLGTADQSLFPQYEFTDFTASTLGSTTARIPSLEMQVTKPLYRPQGTVSYWVQLATQPRISGKPLVGTRVSFAGGGGSYPSSQTINLNSVTARTNSTSSSNWNAVLSNEFTIQSPLSRFAAHVPDAERYPCYKAEDFDAAGAQASHEPEISNPCAAQALSPDKGRIAIRVTGTNNPPQGSTAYGSVALAVVQYLPGGSRHVVDLGGRQLRHDMGNTANFVVRGVQPEYIDDSARYNANGTPYPEYDLYSSIQVYYNVPTRLRFKAQKSGGSGVLRWQGRTAELYQAEYQFRSDDVLCTNTLGACDSLSCTHLHRVQDSTALSLRDRTALHTAQSLYSGCYDAVNSVETAAVALNEKACNLSLTPQSNSSCPDVSLSHDCPPNKGISGLPASGVITNARAASLCPFTGPIPASSSPRSQSWTIEQETILLTSPIRWEQDSCNEVLPATALPDMYSYGYPSIWPGQPTLLPVHEWRILDRQDMELIDFLASHPEYDCAERVDRSIQFSMDDQMFPPESLFGSPQTRAACISDASMKTDAISYGISPHSHFRFSYEPFGTRSTDQKPQTQCEQFQTGTAAGVQRYLGQYAADALPEGCIDGSQRCHLTPVANPESISEFSLDTAQIQAVTEDGILSMLPSARSACASDSCTSVKVQQLPNMHVSIEARTKVPLMILLNRETELSYADQRVLERAMARG